MPLFEKKPNTPVRCRGMGTTFVGVIIENGYLHHAHVGDSRVYLLRDERLMAVTHDHSLLQEFIDQGFI
jgi:serine/threonine protein phosphatase PrpC